MGKEQREERRRCLELVEAYRDLLENTLVSVRATPKYQNLKYEVANAAVEKIIASLRDIEDQIKYPKKTLGADFSMDELAKAEEIIAEQNKNPFEVEP